MLDSTLLDYANIFDVLFHVDIRHQQLCASSYFLLSLYLGHCYINPTFLSRFSKITGQIQMIIIYFLLRQLQCLIMMILWKFIWNYGRLRKTIGQKWYFVTKIVLAYCEKKNVLVTEKAFEIRGWRPRICKIFEITWTIYSNSERSEQFLVTECFF